MDPLSVSAKIISVLQFSAKVLGYLYDVKDAPKERAECAIELSNLNSLLTTLRFRLEERVTTENAPWFSSVRALSFENGPLDQFKQALEELQDKMTGGKFGKVGDALVWKFRKGDITRILVRMERLKGLVQIAVHMDHFKLSQAIKEDSSVIRSGVSTVVTEVATMRLDRDAEQDRKIIDWLSPSDFPSQQHDILSRRQEGTCQWFLDAPQFFDWLGHSRGTLFCPGIPGAGKTMTAATAVDHLVKNERSDSIGVAYLYCNYKDQENQSTCHFLAAILKQLVQAQPKFLEPVQKLYHSETKPSLSEVSEALKKVIGNFQRIFLVVDALDECQDSDGTRQDLVDKLRDLQARSDIRLMVTSRFIPDIEAEFSADEKLEVQASPEDVKRYVNGQLRRLPRCIQKDLELQDMVINKITEAVDGMFLLAQLYTESLLDKRNPRLVKGSLAKFSSGSDALTNAYKGVVQRIESQLPEDLKLARKALSWITHARRPLTKEEICCALAIEPGDEDLNLDGIPDIDDLATVCAGLVVIDDESGIIRLVHYTTQEYFERIMNDWIPDAELNIATMCLSYLTFETFLSTIVPAFEDSRRRRFRCLDALEQKHALLKYAAEYWGIHAENVQPDICDLAWSFFQNEEWSLAVECIAVGHYNRSVPKMAWLHTVSRMSLLHLLTTYISRVGTEQNIFVDGLGKESFTPLFYASEKGHTEIMRILIDNGANIEALMDWGEKDRTPLQVAALNGHEAAVQLLLDRGADINGRANKISFGCPPLISAASKGHEHVVDLLLQRGAEVNATSANLGTALISDSADERESKVRLLLNKGSDANEVKEGGRTAMVAASRRGYTNIIRILLSYGAEIHPPEMIGLNPVLTAALSGHRDCLRFLIENGGDIHVSGGRYQNALQAAVRGGHESTVSLLLAQGADLNAPCEAHDHPLPNAIEREHEHIAKLLLAAGAKASGPPGSLALSYAVRSGMHGMVEILFDAGAELELGRMLHYAARSGNERLVKKFLDAGAKVNEPTDIRGRSTALKAAVGSGNRRVVELLLQEGADVSVVHEIEGGPLHVACRNGNEPLARLLLDAGADVNQVSGLRYGESPLSHNFAFGDSRDLEGLEPPRHSVQMQIARLLLERGAGVGSKELISAVLSGEYEVFKMLLDHVGVHTISQRTLNSLLIQALKRGRSNVVQLLLDHKVGITVLGSSRNPLLEACRYGRLELAKLLLDYGADINAQGRKGNSLIVASRRDQVEIVQLLLERGIDRNAQGPNGNALLSACWAGANQVVQLLIDQGFDVNTEGPSGSALITAISSDFREEHGRTVKILLDNGANINAKGPEGNALQLASRKGDLNVVRLLLDRGCEVNPLDIHGEMLLEALKNNNVEAVRVLLENGADIHYEGEGSETMFLGALAASRQIGTWLLRLVYEKYGPSLALKDREGKNVLHYAAKSGRLENFTYLLDLGIDPGAKDAEDKGLLFYAREGGSSKIVEAVIALNIAQ